MTTRSDRRSLCADDIDTYSFGGVGAYGSSEQWPKRIWRSACSHQRAGQPGSVFTRPGRPELEWTNEGDAKNVYLVVTVAPESVLPEDANRYELRIDVNPPFSCRGLRDVGGDRDSAQVITPNQDGTGTVGDGAMWRAPMSTCIGSTSTGRPLTCASTTARFPLDLRILDAASIIDYGEGPVGFKRAEAVNASGQSAPYYIYVGWNESATEEQRNTDVPFDLRVQVEQGELCPDPQAQGEPNDSRLTSTYLSPSAQPVERHLCGPTDIDWYMLNTVADTPVVIEAEFTHAQGDVDLYLFNSSQRAIAVGGAWTTTSASGSMHRRWITTSVERFAGGQAVQAYTLRSQYTEGCRDDQLEADGGDSSADAVTIRPAGGVFDWSRDLVLCSDTDWYRMIVLAGETITVRATGPEGLSMTLHELDGQNNAGDAVATSRHGGRR